MIGHVVVLVDSLFSDGQGCADGRRVLSFRRRGKKIVDVVHGRDYSRKIGCSTREKERRVLVYLWANKKKTETKQE
jgi:hypothetical protein